VTADSEPLSAALRLAIPSFETSMTSPSAVKSEPHPGRRMAQERHGRHDLLDGKWGHRKVDWALVVLPFWVGRTNVGETRGLPGGYSSARFDTYGQQLITPCLDGLDLEVGLVKQRIANSSADIEHHRIRDAITDADSLASGVDKPGPAQHTKLLRDVGLARSDASDNLTDGELSILEGMENLDANRIAHGLEAHRDPLYKLV